MKTNFDEDKILDIATEIYIAAQILKHRGEGMLDGIERIANIIRREIFAEATAVNTQEPGKQNTLETLLEASCKPVRQGPVAWMVRNPTGSEWPQREQPKVVPPGWSCYPLYAAPPAQEVRND